MSKNEKPDDDEKPPESWTQEPPQSKQRKLVAQRAKDKSHGRDRQTDPDRTSIHDLPLEQEAARPSGPGDQEDTAAQQETSAARHASKFKNRQVMGELSGGGGGMGGDDESVADEAFGDDSDIERHKLLKANNEEDDEDEKQASESSILSRNCLL